MTGVKDIHVLLKTMKPILDEEEYVFATIESRSLNENIIRLNPIATFREAEGITVVITRITAEKSKLSFDAVFNKITLEVHSSLEAVGLTAAISTALTASNISANVIAGYYHDHIFVPIDKSALALSALFELTQ
ncbi:MAG: ACT domain-containing protein [Gammaproteobacteria bacterium]|nr:ACT domain-containing protein [Gammaproteobacteria bacterium]